MPESEAGRTIPISYTRPITWQPGGTLEYDRGRNLLTLRGWRYNDDGPEELTDNETADILYFVSDQLAEMAARLEEGDG